MIQDQQVAEMVHQVAGPLHLAHAYLQDAQTLSGASDEEFYAYLLDAKDAVAGGIDRVRRIVTWDRIRSGVLKIELQSTFLRPAILEVKRAFSERFETHNTAFHLSCPKQLKVLADPRWLEEIIGNLVDNAFTFTRDSIEVVCSRAAERNIRIRVMDNGRGLSHQALEKCFEPRFTTMAKRRGGEGLGLGLTVARRLADKMHGHLEAENRRPPARGAVLTLTLREVQ